MGTYRMQSYDIDANNLTQRHGRPAHVSMVHVNGSNRGETVYIITNNIIIYLKYFRLALNSIVRMTFYGKLF